MVKKIIALTFLMGFFGVILGVKAHASDSFQSIMITYHSKGAGIDILSSQEVLAKVAGDFAAQKIKKLTRHSQGDDGELFICVEPQEKYMVEIFDSLLEIVNERPQYNRAIEKGNVFAGSVPCP